MGEYRRPAVPPAIICCSSRCRNDIRKHHQLNVMGLRPHTESASVEDAFECAGLTAKDVLPARDPPDGVDRPPDYKRSMSFLLAWIRPRCF
jgi:hypothetical protein